MGPPGGKPNNSPPAFFNIFEFLNFPPWGPPVRKLPSTPGYTGVARGPWGTRVAQMLDPLGIVQVPI